jgi:hypothetical protein
VPVRIALANLDEILTGKPDRLGKLELGWDLHRLDHHSQGTHGSIIVGGRSNRNAETSFRASIPSIPSIPDWQSEPMFTDVESNLPPLGGPYLVYPVYPLHVAVQEERAPVATAVRA